MQHVRQEQKSIRRSLPHNLMEYHLDIARLMYLLLALEAEADCVLAETMEPEEVVGILQQYEGLRCHLDRHYKL